MVSGLNLFKSFYYVAPFPNHKLQFCILIVYFVLPSIKKLGLVVGVSQWEKQEYLGKPETLDKSQLLCHMMMPETKPRRQRWQWKVYSRNTQTLQKLEWWVHTSCLYENFNRIPLGVQSAGLRQESGWNLIFSMTVNSMWKVIKKSTWKMLKSTAEKFEKILPKALAGKKSCKVIN